MRRTGGLRDHPRPQIVQIGPVVQALEQFSLYAMNPNRLFRSRIYLQSRSKVYYKKSGIIRIILNNTRNNIIQVCNYAGENQLSRTLGNM